jgi:hypothetical protein
VSVADILRSSTDRTTNVTLLAGTRLEEDLPGLLRPGGGPERLAPAFLHEATHYWCFDSQVGQALAILKLRIQDMALGFAHTGSRHLLDFLARALAKYQAAVAVLHPLDEGMACFAEFDLITRSQSRVFSRPVEYAARFFGQFHGPGGSGDPMLTTAWCQGFTQRMRLRAELIDRKVNVLGQPLTCVGDGYLAGYLTVRRLWRAATERDWRLASETDLFLMYLRALIYEDPVLVAALLDNSDPAATGAARVVNRILNRLNLVFDLDPDLLARYEAAVDEGTSRTDRHGYLATLMVNMGEGVLGDTVLENALKHYAGPAPQTEAERTVWELGYHILARRQFLYLGSWQAEIEVTAGRCRILADGELVHEVDARPGAPEGSGPGTVEVCYWVPRHDRVCAVFRDNLGVALDTMLGNGDDETLVDLLSLRDQSRELILTLDELVTTIAENTWVSGAVEHVANQITATLDQQLLWVALSGVPADRFDSVVAAMREDGLFGLLGYDRRLIEGMAALGLFCSVFPPYEAMAPAYFERFGLDYAATIAAADRLHEEHGIGRVWREGGQFISSI